MELLFARPGHLSRLDRRARHLDHPGVGLLLILGRVEALVGDSAVKAISICSPHFCRYEFASMARFVPCLLGIGSDSFKHNLFDHVCSNDSQ